MPRGTSVTLSLLRRNSRDASSRNEPKQHLSQSLQDQNDLGEPVKVNSFSVNFLQSSTILI